MTDVELIEKLEGAFGGVRAVATRLSVSRGAVSMWKLRAEVPSQYDLPLWMLATEAGIDWTPPAAQGLMLVRRAA